MFNKYIQNNHFDKTLKIVIKLKDQNKRGITAHAKQNSASNEVLLAENLISENNGNKL